MNLTISVSDDIVKAARMRALEQGTSVNEVLRQFLTRYADVGQQRSGALHDLFQDVDASLADRERLGGRNWRREDAYDDARFR
ncbi:hypothetical protein [Nitrococcus mobilis]|uniref:Ribbon-helix-helix protein CopG domain-containing protein n=1 Tax=Nitrococcus mobilis Nb-231 TaxID=314278 RepID=A4BM88_9GAMM|nr:hypothetical protein [Nitrococcus mobilis]EAR23426.1 hypothetical protein NB231_16438 [Nitrococcus mobilis Nb-231]